MLFLLVLLLVSGWSLEPLAAAAAVSVLPLAAFAGARIRGPAAVRASAGCALVGAGVLALAVLPGAAIAWIVAPQLLAGAGMGMALPALAGELLPGRTPGQAAWLLTVRHAGITLALLLIAPIVAAQLDGAVSDARERGAALVLDARLPPLEKVELAGPLVAKLDTVNPRDSLRAALDDEAGALRRRSRAAARVRRADRARRRDGRRRHRGLVPDRVRDRRRARAGRRVRGAPAGASQPHDRAGGDGSRRSPCRRVHAVARPMVAPAPVTIADPCASRDLPGTGGIDGFVQDAALVALDRAACRYGSSREELALALADEDAARAFRAAHGVDPRSTDGLLDIIGISLG